MAKDVRSMTMEQVGEEIGRLMGDIPLHELPSPFAYSWWHPEKPNVDAEGRPAAKGGYVTFQRGKPHPWFPKVIVCAMFRDAEELRVYTLPGPEGLGEDEYGVRRYFLSKKDSGSFEIEFIPVEAFPQMIADEWLLVAEGVRTAEREKNQIVAFLETLDDKETASDAAAAIAQGQHWLEPVEPTPEPPAPNGATVSPPEPLPG